MDSNDDLMNTFVFISKDIPCSSPKKNRKKASCVILCSRMLATKFTLNRHNARLHTDPKEFACNECNKRFSLKRDLKQHKIFHKNKNMSGIKYSSEDKLNHHQASHKQEDSQFKCEHCGKMFINKTNYRQHLQSHKDTYECEICLKVLKSRYTFKMHMKSHTEGPQLPCEFCSLEYMDKPRLKKHMKRIHSDKIENIGQSSTTRVAPEPVPSPSIRNVANKKMRSILTDTGYSSQ